MSITCEVCGTVNPTGTQFCEGCGVELKASTAAETATPAAATPAAMSTDAMSTDAMSTGTVSQPDLGSPTLPPAPSIPDAPVMPAPALDSQASVPSGLEAPVPDSGMGTQDGMTTGTGTTDETVPAAPTATPVMDESVPADTGANDTGANDTGANEVESAPSGTETEAAPTVNPDLTSTADAPLTDAAVSANAPAMANPEGAMETASTETPAAAAAPAESGTPRTGEAKLGIKKFGNATGDFIPLQGERLMVGRFDASSGPVDIDLSSLPGAEHISRHHAELYREGGQWFVRDLGSTNGVFVRKGSQSAFSPRLQEPTALTDGDELAFGNLMLTFHQD
ncbi:FHA domain-containing protein (plasmid) [Deinococcus wulumuqiensis]|uniref:FHA domain-containing protein n=1 Tax=Deinococcus wulumuqiensis TaxID=980427 RepID=A0A345IKX0_9DEIO|nr:FHA domain-containing protein [Deinococcus wulumuqiensis]AXH00343.1 FHA domain-containing protein [Deinococcus wulumuqiensis]